MDTIAKTSINDKEYPPSSVSASDAMDAEYRRMLIRVIANQTRAENIAADLYLKWSQRVMNPMIRLRLVHLAQEEVEHWAGCVALLEELGIEAKNVTSYYSASWFYNIAKLISYKFKWLDLAMASFLFEQVGYIFVEDYSQSSYIPHANLSKKILIEEAEHPEHAIEYVNQLIENHGHNNVQKSLRKLWPIALSAFGPSNAPSIEKYIHYGLKVRTNDGRREVFRETCGSRIKQLGLDIPKVHRNKYPYF